MLPLNASDLSGMVSFGCKVGRGEREREKDRGYSLHEAAWFLDLSQAMKVSHSHHLAHHVTIQVNKPLMCTVKTDVDNDLLAGRMNVNNDLKSGNRQSR